jgi:tetratricopeptide (TPR) repeat protein
MERAVALDTTFAEAYRRLWAAHGTSGNTAAARRNIELAYRFRDRNRPRERLLTIASYHSDFGRRDSAIYYYRLGIERYPKERYCFDAERNNLGNLFFGSGRFEEALQVWLEVREIHLRCGGGGYINPTQVGRVARVLGQHALADSMLAILRERVPGSYYALAEAATNAYYAGHIALTDSLARVMASDSRGRVARTGRLLLAGLASMYGRVKQALALADSVAAPELDWQDLWLIEHASLAAGVSERALLYVESFRSQFTLGTPGRTEHNRLGVIAYGYALAGELQSAQDVLAVMDSLAESNDFQPSGIGEKTLALIALQQMRAEDAVEHLQRATAANYGLQRWDARWLLAEAHAALGQLAEAIAQYDTLTGTYRLHYWDTYVSFPLRPLAHERLGSLYLEVGDTVAAARHLAEFIELWKDADPELQPRVESARRLLAQLVAEETG